MTFVGVDQAQRVTGLCVLRPGSVELSELVIKSRGPDRIVEYRDRLMEFLEGVGPVRMAALEAGAYSGSGRVFQLGGVNALTQLCFCDAGISFIEPTAQQVKGFLTGIYDASKERMQDAAEAELGWRPSEDEADAYALARLVRAYATQDVRTRMEARIVVKLDKQGRFHGR